MSGLLLNEYELMCIWIGAFAPPRPYTIITPKGDRIRVKRRYRHDFITEKGIRYFYDTNPETYPGEIPGYRGLVVRQSCLGDFLKAENEWRLTQIRWLEDAIAHALQDYAKYARRYFEEARNMKQVEI